MKKIVYYNVSGDLSYEQNLLKEWKIKDLELIEVKDEGNKQFIPLVSHYKPDGLVVEYQRVDAQDMDQLPGLKIISLQSIGYNNIDVAAADIRNICVTNAPGFCAREVAEHAIGMLLSLSRKIPMYDRNVRAGRWDPFVGYEMSGLKDKVIGLVFFGEIPKHMVPVLKALGMQVIVYAPTKSRRYLQTFQCEKADTLEELLTQSDVVSLHCPLIPGVTYHLIGEKELWMMKEDAFLINTARGSVVDEKALIRALQEGWIRGAGIDVLEDETEINPALLSLENLVITPHAAFMSKDSYYLAKKIALRQQVIRLHDQKMPEYPVNQKGKIQIC
ncbi:MAG: C-terminal binding protein [Lachnospiraceae bacterium]